MLITYLMVCIIFSFSVISFAGDQHPIEMIQEDDTNNTGYVNLYNCNRYYNNRERILTECYKVNQHGWKAFANKIGIIEGNIDELNKLLDPETQSTKLIMLEIMKQFEGMCEPNEIVRSLLSALEKSDHVLILSKIKGILQSD